MEIIARLRRINETMEIKGALQPGLPLASTIPRNTFKIVIDLKDCFYTISLAPTAVLWPNGTLLWLHLSVSPAKNLQPYYEGVTQLVQSIQCNARTYFGLELSIIVIAFTGKQLDWLFQICDSWAIAFAYFSGQIKFHYPPNKLLQFANLQSFIFPKNHFI